MCLLPRPQAKDTSRCSDWSGAVEKTGKSSAAIGSTIDLYPTFLDAAKVAPPKQQVLDGVSLVPVFRNPATNLKRDTLYWHVPHYHHATPASAMRQGIGS